MRALEKRLCRLEVGLLPPAETAVSRLHEIVLDIRRRRAARLGLPEPEDVEALEPGWRRMSLGEIILAAREHQPVGPMPVPQGDPEPVCRPGMSIGETILAARERHAAEEAKGRQ